MRGETGTWDRPELPDALGRFGSYGGVFVPETLVAPLRELAGVYDELRHDTDFQTELERDLRLFAGRPTPLSFAENLSESLGGARIYLKREDLAHTGSHAINSAVGQILVARRMGRSRVIADTSTGLHGIATAATAARHGMACTIYVGARHAEERLIRQVRLLGAEIVVVEEGTGGLTEAVSAAWRDWLGSFRHTHYVVGSAYGPHPFPRMVRDFQSVIGLEARQQSLDLVGRLPDVLVACVGRGANAIGLFYPFLRDDSVAMVGIEAAGRGIHTGRHAARFTEGTRGVLHGTAAIVLQDADGMVVDTHSIAPGLDYPAVGPEHCLLQESGRARYESMGDDEAREAFHRTCELEGIVPALEAAHAMAWVLRKAPTMARPRTILMCLSGRGEKDLDRGSEASET